MHSYRDRGISGRYLELCKGPDVVAELDGLVDHILSLEVPLGHGKDVVLQHLRGDSVGVALDTLQRVLHLVLRRNVPPRGQEHLLLHLAVAREEDVHGRDAGEVEDIHVVFDRHLRSGFKYD